VARAFDLAGITNTVGAHAKIVKAGPPANRPSYAYGSALRNTCYQN